MRSGKVKYRTLKMLLYSDTNTTIISGSLVHNSQRKNNTTTNWDTRGGVFQTQYKATLSFKLPELDHAKTITYAMHVADKKNSNRYGMIMGRDLMKELGLYIKFSYYKIRGESPGPF